MNLDQMITVSMTWLLGGDICTELGLLIDYKHAKVGTKLTCLWSIVKYSVRIQNFFNDLYESTSESKPVCSATSRMMKILDNDYHKAGLLETAEKCKHLTLEEQKQLYNVLRKHELLFEGTLGKWNVPPLPAF